MILLDTDTCIAILRGHKTAMANRRRSPGPAGTTWITAAELYFGAAKSRAPRDNKALVDRFLNSLPIIGLDSLSASLFGLLKADFEERGTRLPDADLWIASIALTHKATLVTGNTRHFSRIARLHLENWMEE